MKALSIKQPWAYLIVRGFKDIENRDWQTKYRGTIIVHSSKWSDDNALYGGKAMMDRLGIPWPKRETIPTVMAFGAIVGMVDIVDCVEESDSPWFMGRFGFVLANPRIITPAIPYKGKLGLYDIPDSVLSAATIISADQATP